MRVRTTFFKDGFARWVYFKLAMGMYVILSYLKPGVLGTQGGENYLKASQFFIAFYLPIQPFVSTTEISIGARKGLHYGNKERN